MAFAEMFNNISHVIKLPEIILNAFYPEYRIPSSYERRIENKKIFNQIKSGSTDKLDVLINNKAYHELRYIIVKELIDLNQLTSNDELMDKLCVISMLFPALIMFKGYSISVNSKSFNPFDTVSSFFMDYLRNTYNKKFLDIAIDANIDGDQFKLLTMLKLALLLEDETKLQQLMEKDLIDFNISILNKSFFYHCCENLPRLAEKLLDEDQINNFDGPIIEILLDQDEIELALRVLPHVKYPQDKYYLLLLALVGDVDKIEGLLDFDEEEKEILNAIPLEYGNAANRQQLLSHWQ